MFEQVRGLGVDLERVLLVEQVGVEPLVGHETSVLQPNTNRRGCGAVLRPAGVVSVVAA
jgi:hypothetical protein